VIIIVDLDFCVHVFVQFRWTEEEVRWQQRVVGETEIVA